MARYFEFEELSKLFGEPFDVFLSRLDLKLPPTADVIKREDVLGTLYQIRNDLEKEMDECLIQNEYEARYYLKAKRTMTEHIISIFEEGADDAKIH